MAHGGGVWLTQNKVLPGYYHNVVSLPKATATLSDRGVAAVPFNLSWGEVGKVFIVERSEFFKNSTEIFGYDYTAPQMWALREVFSRALKVVCYRLGASGENGHVAASCDYATAKYPGTRGNDIKLVVKSDPDLPENETGFVVETHVGYSCAEAQKVKTYNELVDNVWVNFDKQNVDLAITTGMNLTGGIDGTPIGVDYSAFLAAIEPYSFNTLCCPAVDATTVDLFYQYTESQRDDYGVKFQLVAWKPNGDTGDGRPNVDYEGVIGLWNSSTHSTISVPENAAVYWVAGAEAACAINKTLTNTEYDGELNIDVNYKQSQLEEAINKGRFMFHNVNGDVRVLEDINTFTEVTDTKGDIFKSNQTMRVVDQISNDIAVLFCTRYLGKVQNDKPGRATLWYDLVHYCRQLETLRAIEDFDPEIITCELGETKKSVLVTVNGLNIINAMSQLYMTTVVK